MDKKQKLLNLQEERQNIKQEEETWMLRKVAPLIEKRKKVEEEIALLVCPFDIGNHISNGKDSWMIAYINYNSYGSFRMYGKKLKKDGTPGKSIRELYFISVYDCDNWKVIKPQTKGEK